MDAWNELFDQITSYCGDMSQLRVLDVGCDTEGHAIEVLVKKFKVAEATGINQWSGGRTLPQGCKIVHGDIRKSPFPDGYFDLIFSSSAFEHIQDIDIALDEMFRILKPGGQLFSHFGPIWSTSYGHHLWLMHNNQLYNYWNVILPSFCHLLQTPQEVYEGLLLDYPSDVSEVITNYVFDSPEQNKLFFNDYEYLIQNSKFETIFFKGYDHPELSRIYSKSISPEVFKRLHSRYPRCSGFLYDGITTLLRKPN